MTNTIADRIARLERQAERLEYRNSLILRLLDSDKDPLGFFALEHDLNSDQVAGICAVMEYAHKALEQGAPLEPLEFEKRMLPHIPAKGKPNNIAYDFMKFILMTFDTTGQWDDVVEHHRRDYNVPRLDFG